ncbi:MAG: hypothetical protein KDC52_14900 [Ignavibacteriae bacterium]|nr:hypothetical protein [Ignavibacteriota bacterium]
MKTRISLYMQEFNESWPGQSGTKTRIAYLTNKYIHALNQLDLDAEVTITFSSEDGSKATEEEMDFVVQAKNKEEEDKIWDTIIRTKNNITD